MTAYNGLGIHRDIRHVSPGNYTIYSILHALITFLCTKVPVTLFLRFSTLADPLRFQATPFTNQFTESERSSLTRTLDLTARRDVGRAYAPTRSPPPTGAHEFDCDTPWRQLPWQPVANRGTAVGLAMGYHGKLRVATACSTGCNPPYCCHGTCHGCAYGTCCGTRHGRPRQYHANPPPAPPSATPEYQNRHTSKTKAAQTDSWHLIRDMK